MLTRMSFHSTISTIFKDYNSLLMLQSSPFNVSIANRIPKFIGFMKLACRFGHSKEKMDLYASLHYQEYCQHQKYLLKLYSLEDTESPNLIQILPGIKV